MTIDPSIEPDSFTLADYLEPTPADQEAPVAGAATAADTLPDPAEHTVGDWAADARCRGVDPAIFHPVATGATSPSPPAHDPIWALPAAYCAACPVRADCLAHALTADERDGMWGGRTPDERRRLRTTAQMAPPDERAADAVAMRRDGAPIRDICKALHVNHKTLARWLRDAGLD